MDILIPDSWLREFLKTKAKPTQIGKHLSLSGPSVERINKTQYGPVYSIEVTTNRVDSVSVYGIAREAAVILSRFGIKASLQSIKPINLAFSKQVKYLDVEVDHKLCSRFTAVLVKNVTIKSSPLWMKERLMEVGVRPLNNVIDISNYIMHEIGQPVHTFDYDKIMGHKMFLRQSQKGENLTTLDGKIHTLLGGDIVIEDGEKRLIDLAGIMGAENSAVDAGTKNVLLFVQTYNPVNIRRTSMSLAQRTEAAVLFEKGLDPELVTIGISRGIELFTKLTEGKTEKKILDLYPNRYKIKKLEVDINFITKRLGVALSKSEISKMLTALGFETMWKANMLTASIPSWRANDIDIPEDIVEEVGRIYGYHNLPSELMTGPLPQPLSDSPFNFEVKVKRFLKGVGGIEVYTSSLTSKDASNSNAALKLKNPLGPETEFLRMSLTPSLIEAASQNSGEKEPFHLFEMANIYIPRKGNLPDEQMYLAGIFSNYSYREAKGIVESLLEELNVNYLQEPEDSQHFVPSKRLLIKSGKDEIGQFGVLENGKIYYEFDVEKLRKVATEIDSYKPLPKYPAQIEDITLNFPAKTKVGEVISFVSRISYLISNIELTGIYKDAYTFRIWYQDPTKTLTDKEVEGDRNKLLKNLKDKFGAILKN